MSQRQEKFKMTGDEAEKLQKALKNEEFRKLLFEYAEEISDPVNRERYEREIAELEKERGSDVTFVHPKPGFVMKAYVDKEKKEKIFINICHAEEVKPATSEAAVKPDGSRGQTWSLPHSMAPPREDLDKAKNRCMIYDIVFNPATLELEKTDARFRQLIIDTALEGLAREFDMHLKMADVHILKRVTYKGVPQATVLRKASAQNPGKETRTDAFSEKLESMYPYKSDPTAPKPMASSNGGSSDAREPRGESTPTTAKQSAAVGAATVVTDLKYRIVQRGYFDLQDFRMSRDSTPGCRPKELAVAISLPEFESASGLELDILPQELTLAIEKHDIDMTIPLPYPVNEDNGTATFDRSRRELIVTLNVLPPPVSDPQTALDTDSTSDNADEVDVDTTESIAETAAAVSDTLEADTSESPPACSGACQPSHDLLTSPATTSTPGENQASDHDSDLQMRPFPESPVLPDVRLYQTDSMIVIHFASAGASDIMTTEEDDLVNVAWDVKYYQVRHQVAIASSEADRHFTVASASCKDERVIVQLRKLPPGDRITWQSLCVGRSSHELQVIKFAEDSSHLLPVENAIPSTDSVPIGSSAESMQQASGKAEVSPPDALLRMQAVNSQAEELPLFATSQESAPLEEASVCAVYQGAQTNADDSTESSINEGASNDQITPSAPTREVPAAVSLNSRLAYDLDD